MSKTLLSYLSVVINVVLLLLKLWAGWVSGSIAAVSDALNSFLDVFSYTALSLAVYVQDKEPDETHPFGHRRAEPLAGMVIAVLAAILGGSIIKDSLVSFFVNEPINVTPGVLVVLAAAVAIKVVQASLYYIVGRRTNSKGLLAGYVDSRNDVLASSIVFIGVFIGRRVDEVAALLIGVWILYSGIRVGLENAGYLLGRAADEVTIAAIRDIALNVPGVKGIDEIRAHFVGDQIHADVHIEVDGDLSVKEAHDISEKVKNAVDDLPEVHNTFVHIDIHSDDELTLHVKGQGNTRF